MRFVCDRRFILVGWFLVASLHAAQLRAGDDGSTVTLRSAPPTPAAIAASSSPAPQPIPRVAKPITAAAPSIPAEPPQPAPPPPTASTPPSTFPRLGTAARTFTQPLIEPQVTNQTRQALSFYGGYSARATLSQLPRRASIQPSSPRPIRRQAKPFQGVHRDPTVSPYMNLYRDENNGESAPNYFAFVRPQMEQLDANRMQQREIEQLRGQLQSISPTTAGPRYQAAGMPGTGTAARYMDTAQFYGGLRR